MVMNTFAHILKISLITTFMIISLGACTQNDATEKPLKKESYIVVTFNPDGGSMSQTTKNIPLNGMVNRPQNPVREGFEFIDWYTEAESNTPYDFKNKVTKNLTLRARWGFDIKDKAFRTLLQQKIPLAFTISNEKHLLVTTHPTVSSLTKIDIVSYPEFIQSLSGIEFFANLKTLNIMRNNIKEIDLSHNTKLDTLFCDQNLLTKLDLSKNTNLINIYSTNENLSELLLPNSDKLEDIMLNGTAITAIDLSHNLKLKHLEITRSTKLKSIDITKNRALESFNFFNSGDGLKTLDLSKNDKLRYFRYNGNNMLTTLDIRGLRKSTYYYIEDLPALTEIKIHKDLTINKMDLVKSLKKSNPNLRISLWSGEVDAYILENNNYQP